MDRSILLPVPDGSHSRTASLICAKPAVAGNHPYLSTRPRLIELQIHFDRKTRCCCRFERFEPYLAREARWSDGNSAPLEVHGAFRDTSYSTRPAGTPSH